VTSFRIDLANLYLWRNSATGADERVELTPKTFDVLRYLVEHPGRLVTHDELLDAVWPGVHVQPEVLKSHVLAIRNALGDEVSSPRYIETQRGRGYRFIGTMDRSRGQNASRHVAPELGLFAGRDEFMADFATRLRQASAGERQAVFVSGEAGIGKTTLVEQFLSTALVDSNLALAEGYCIEGFAGAEPYYPVLEALRDMCKGDERTGVARALSEFAPAWQAQIPEHLSLEQRSKLPDQVATDARSGMVREACGLFEALAAERPLVLLLEDLHWADFATIDFISALCRRRSSAQLLLIGTYRSEGAETVEHPLQQMIRDLALRRNCSEMDLAPLSEEATAVLLNGGQEPTKDSLEFARFIRKHSGGNPLFMRETLEFLVQRGDVARTERGWRPLVPMMALVSEIPPTLQKAIEIRIESMSADRQQVLEAASVAGLTFDPTMVSRPAGMDEQAFEAVCENLSRKTKIIQRDELLVLPNNVSVRSYAFNHAVYRQVLYNRIGQSRRTQLHRAIAERLEEIYPPDRRSDLAMPLAQHFGSARDWLRALDYLRVALRVANSRYAWRDALAILDQAFALATNLPDTARFRAEIELLERRGTIEGVAHDPQASETYAELAAKAGHHGDIDAQCRALIGLAFAASLSDLAYSLQVLDKVLILSEQQTDPIQRDVTRMVAHARRLMTSGWNMTEARECDDALARLKSSADSLTIARAQVYFSMLCLVSSRYREVKELLDSSYGLLRESSVDVVEAALASSAWMRLTGIPWALFSLGKCGAALAELDASIAAFEKDSEFAAASLIKAYRGALHFYIMDFEGVLLDCRPLTSRPLEHGAGRDARILPLARRMAQIFCGLAESGLGHHAAALEYLRTAEDEMGERPIQMDWYWGLPLEWGMVNVLISMGDLPAARDRAARLCDLAMQTDERTSQALAWEARARVDLALKNPTEALGNLANALNAGAGVQIPLANWRVHATWAAAHRAGGDMALATTHAELGLAVTKRLAESLPEGHPLRLKFESRSAAFFDA
jgi:DNA-binding winged helix-turn-helix (wHTH) protein